MRPYIKVDKLRLAQTNKYNVYGCIVREGPINRAAVARRTDLSLPTVMAITGELLEKGALMSVGKGESGAGKPPEMLEADPRFFYTIGVDLGRTAVRVVINDAVLGQKFSYEETTGDTFPAEAFILRLGKLIRKFQKSLSPGTAVLGAGIAMPGLIESGSGKVIISPDFGWKDVPLQARLQKNLPFPVLVRNSNHALALNESALDGDGEYRASFCVNLAYGIGAALIIGDELYDGAGGTGGELGHSVVEKGGPLCKCGNSGCLESVASGEAIARQAAVIAAHHGGSKIAGLCGGDVSRIDARMVFRAAEEGDESARKILATAADYIGMGLSTAVNVLDPDRVILCGGLMKNGPFFLEQIRAAMNEHVMPHAGRKLELAVGGGGEYSTARGASRALFNSFLTNQALPI
jgi:predicted NBD/HSP70 family sugar kinase